MNKVQTGKVYRILPTDNTNEIAEKLQMNICDKRAVVMDEWLGQVNVRVNIGRGVWTEPMLLKPDDLTKDGAK